MIPKPTIGHDSEPFPLILNGHDVAATRFIITLLTLVLTKPSIYTNKLHGI
jgi:hypothetical protein